MDTLEQSDKSTYRLDMIARNLIYVVAFLLPLAVLPSAWMPLAMTKMAILSLGMLGALLLWLVARLKEHRASFPDTHVFWTAVLLILGYFLAAILSSNVLSSLIGFGYEIDTVISMFTFVGALAAVALTTRKVAHFIRLQKAVMIAFVILAVFQIARILVGGENLLPSIFSSNSTATTLGSWNDLAVFSGLAVITSLSGLALFSSRKIRMGLYAIIALSVFLLVVVNMVVVWATLALAAFALSVYIFGDSSYDRETGSFRANLPYKRLIPSVSIIALSIVFLVAGAAIGSKVSSALDVSYLDVRPSWEGTITIGSGVFQEDALLGIGPSLFREGWVQHKPLGINETNFWNSEFNFGVGLIPTAFVTGGIVLGVIWLLFFAAFLHLGFKVLSKRIVQPGLMYITVSSYIGAVYLWILTIVYVPQTVMLAYTFMLTGVAVAAARIVGVIRTREVSAEQSYASGLAHTGAIVMMVVLVSGALLIHVDRIAVTSLLSGVVATANSGDLDKAEKKVNKISVLGTGIRGVQLKTSIGVAQLSAILAEEESEDIEDQRTRFQETLARTITSAQQVVAADRADYRGWVLLGDIYAQLIPLEIEGSYESAIAAYREAQARNPKNPAILISISQLAFGQEDLEGSRVFAEEALKLKSNYTDAYYILSQISIQENNTAEAIKATEAAVVLRPGNAGLLFQLGVLQYSVGNYDRVIPVLERAVTVNPDYSNALYFLGLAYDETDDVQGAISVFQRIVTLNPDNVEVAAILEALKSGQSAKDAIGETSASTPPVTK
ncbi:hypothetical protein COB52_00970 [Candidatus Kaiserbacteria bacterium]|nr:MAG: hypothetical protein COB52_00970 [Candidatus Kaiserbacteria bacterium]